MSTKISILLFVTFVWSCVSVDISKYGSEESEFSVSNENEQDSFFRAVKSTIVHHPYMAHVTKNGKKFLCFGVLITSSDVLITANCVKLDRHNASDISVILGSFTLPVGVNRHEVVDIIRHPNYNHELESNRNWPHYNLAILRLKYPVSFSDKINPIQIATDQDIDDFNGKINGRQTCTTFVWNHQQNSSTTETMTIDPIRLQLMSFDYCKRVYSAMSNETEFCCTYTSSHSFPCRRNLGSPLVCQEKLYGLHIATLDCKDQPELFVRVDTMYDFVKKLFTVDQKPTMVNRILPKSASRTRFPFVVLVERNESMCSGVLLTERLVLTSSFCIGHNRLDDPSINISVVMDGGYGEEIEPCHYHVDKIYRLPSKNKRSNEYVILKLDKEAIVESISLRPVNNMVHDKLDDCYAIVLESNDRNQFIKNDALSQFPALKNITIRSVPTTKCNVTQRDDLCVIFDGTENICIMTGAPIMCNNKLYALHRTSNMCVRSYITPIIYHIFDDLMFMSIESVIKSASGSDFKDTYATFASDHAYEGRSIPTNQHTNSKRPTSTITQKAISSSLVEHSSSFEDNKQHSSSTFNLIMNINNGPGIYKKTLNANQELFENEPSNAEKPTSSNSKMSSSYYPIEHSSSFISPSSIHNIIMNINNGLGTYENLNANRSELFENEHANAEKPSSANSTMSSSYDPMDRSSSFISPSGIHNIIMNINNGPSNYAEKTLSTNQSKLYGNEYANAEKPTPKNAQMSNSNNSVEHTSSFTSPSRLHFMNINNGPGVYEKTPNRNQSETFTNEHSTAERQQKSKFEHFN